jgi:hypothetical protein
MQDKKKDEGDQALIRQQRSEQRSNGKPDRETGARRAHNEHRGNGEPRPAPTAGGVTPKQDQDD